MAGPMHTIHTIHGTFSGISSYANRSPPATSYSSRVGVVGVADYSYAAANQRAIPATVSLPVAGSSKRPQRPRLIRNRIPPPPFAPLSTSRIESVPFPVDDPFADKHALSPASILGTSDLPRSSRVRAASHSITVRLPERASAEVSRRRAMQDRDREVRLKAVAGILLNRVNAVGKPMRRTPSDPDVPKTYRRSSLSIMLNAEDI